MPQYTHRHQSYTALQCHSTHTDISHILHYSAPIHTPPSVICCTTVPQCKVPQYTHRHQSYTVLQCHIQHIHLLCLLIVPTCYSLYLYDHLLCLLITPTCQLIMSICPLVMSTHHAYMSTHCVCLPCLIVYSLFLLLMLTCLLIMSAYHAYLLCLPITSTCYVYLSCLLVISTYHACLLYLPIMLTCCIYLSCLFVISTCHAYLRWQSSQHGVSRAAVTGPPGGSTGAGSQTRVGVTGGSVAVGSSAGCPLSPLPERVCDTASLCLASTPPSAGHAEAAIPAEEGSF